MSNIQKSIGALISSFFLIFDVSAMQSPERPRYEIAPDGYYQITKYPDFSRTLRTIDIEVSYGGITKQILSIYLYLSILAMDEGLSKYNIIKELREEFPWMPDDLRGEIAKQCFADAKERYQSLMNAS
mgnify:CR=1 FL=1